MGWDAYARGVKRDWRADRIVDDESLRLAFEDAANEVQQKTGTADGLLRMGGLDVSTCAYMLERATGFNAWDERGWDKDMVDVAFRAGNWDFGVAHDELWAYWSARKFIEVCAKHGLAVEFSW